MFFGKCPADHLCALEEDRGGGSTDRREIPQGYLHVAIGIDVRGRFAVDFVVRSRVEAEGRKVMYVEDAFWSRRRPDAESSQAVFDPRCDMTSKHVPPHL